ncbi:MAG: hypothetical protein IKM08_06475 [Clostridia bacterium]|nr:hypothetical protein [Clostridia bacterium]
MKKHVFSMIALLLCCALLFLATACSDGIDTDKAEADAESFLAAVSEGDYDTAATYLHPDRPVDLATYFTRIEERELVDFSDGIEIVRKSGSSYSYYESEVDGSAYEMDLDVRIGGIEAEIEIELVQNENGYGIYNFEIDVDD